MYSKFSCNFALSKGERRQATLTYKQQKKMKTRMQSVMIAGKSYNVESYSDEGKIYVEAGDLLDVVTVDNAEEVMSDLTEIAEGIAFAKARDMIEGTSMPYGSAEVMMSFKDIEGEGVYLFAECELYADSSVNGKMYTDISVCLPEYPYCEDDERYSPEFAVPYEVIREELMSLQKHERVSSDEMDEIIEANQAWCQANIEE